MDEDDKGESPIPEETKEELKAVDGSESSLLEGNPTSKNETAETANNGERTPKGRRKSSKREWTEEMINIDGGDVKYFLFGSKRENSNLCIILHGLDFISAHFKSLIESIGMMKGTTALAFDFLGRGESSFADGVSETKFFVQQIDSILNKLNFKQKSFTLIGHDLGGAVALLYTLENPERVASLILISPLGMPQKKSVLSSIAKASGFNTMMGSMRRRKNVEGHRKAFVKPIGDVYEKSLEVWQRQIERKGYMSSHLMLVNTFPIHKLRKEYEALEKLRKKVLILWGEEDHFLPCLEVPILLDSLQNQKLFSSFVPSADFVVIPQSGHACFVEKHGEVFSFIKLFLRGKSVALAPLKERFQFCMLLSAAGDAIGYKNGAWEFESNGKYIHDELRRMGGVAKLSLDTKQWRVSDETITHMATAEALLSEWKDLPQLYSKLVEKYSKAFKNMGGRGPGVQYGKALPFLESGEWEKIPSNSSGGGSGAASRSMAIGLWFHSPSQLNDLLRAVIASARMSHNHPVGVLGSVCAALFTSYALQRIPPSRWGQRMLNKVLPLCKKIVQADPSLWEEYSANWEEFGDKWSEYLKRREILEGKGQPVFPEDYNLFQREKFYKKLSVSGIGGSSGHDCVIIAYDALLGAGNSWEELVLRGVLHGGDSDSTGAIAGAWFGALYGGRGVAGGCWQQIEFRKELEELAESLVSQSGVTEGRLRKKDKENATVSV